MLAAPHILAINGIRTPAAQASWPKRLIPFLESRYRCTGESYYYETGPVPPWNLWVTNPRIAAVLGNAIEERMEEIGPHPVHIVAHSNGSNIAVSLAKALAKRDIRTETMILIGAAIHSDVAKNGLADLIASGHLRRAVAYCSTDDMVVRCLQDVPGFYGSLGSRGFERGPTSTGLRVAAYQPLGVEWGADRWRYVTRWFPGFGHSDYFGGLVREVTFACIARDLALEVPTSCPI